MFRILVSFRTHQAGCAFQPVLDVSKGPDVHVTIDLCSTDHDLLGHIYIFDVGGCVLPCPNEDLKDSAGSVVMVSVISMPL